MIDENTSKALEQGISPEFEDVYSGMYGAVAPYVPEDDDGPVLEEVQVSRLQAKLALLKMGLLEPVEALIALMDQATQLAWAEATTFSRGSPLLNGIGAAITWPDGSPLTDDDIDTLFDIARQIEV